MSDDVKPYTEADLAEWETWCAQGPGDGVRAVLRWIATVRAVQGENDASRGRWMERTGAALIERNEWRDHAEEAKQEIARLTAENAKLKEDNRILMDDVQRMGADWDADLAAKSARLTAEVERERDRAKAEAHSWADRWVVVEARLTAAEQRAELRTSEVLDLETRLAAAEAERDQAIKERDQVGADANALRELVNSIVDWDKEWHGLELEITKAALDRGAGAAWLREHDKPMLEALEGAKRYIGNAYDRTQQVFNLRAGSLERRELAEDVVHGIASDLAATLNGLNAVLRAAGQEGE